jgi:hypothetical protein
MRVPVAALPGTHAVSSAMHLAEAPLAICGQREAADRMVHDQTTLRE